MIDLPVALPPNTEMVTMTSANRMALGGLILITRGTTISTVLKPSVASFPVREAGPKLSWIAAGKEENIFSKTSQNCYWLLGTTKG